MFVNGWPHLGDAPVLEATSGLVMFGGNDVLISQGCWFMMVGEGMVRVVNICLIYIYILID